MQHNRICDNSDHPTSYMSKIVRFSPPGLERLRKLLPTSPWNLFTKSIFFSFSFPNVHLKKISSNFGFSVAKNANIFVLLGLFVFYKNLNGLNKNGYFFNKNFCSVEKPFSVKQVWCKFFKQLYSEHRPSLPLLFGESWVHSQSSKQ